MKVFTMLLVTLLATSFVFATGEVVDFRVNMKVKSIEGTFNPTEDIVLVRGTFNTWGTVDTLTDLDNDSIYTKSVSIANVPGDTIYFKFFYWDVSDTYSEHYEGGSDREYIILPDADTFEDYFDRDAFVSVPVDVEFRANMRIKALKGQFDPAADYVLVRGSFNGWNESDTLKDLDNDSIYTKTISVMSYEALGFKFFFRDVSGAVDNWESDPNREYTPPATPSVYEDFFNKDSFYVPQYDIVFFFGCNMELERLSGRFNPGDDSVSVNGGFNGWASMVTLMTPNGLNPDLYEAVDTITAGLGDNIEFKYWYQENNWESVPNRSHIITSEDITNGYVIFEASFNDGTLETVINQACTTKFTVYMPGAVSAISTNPFPVVNTVHIAGSSSPLQWPSGGWPDSDSNVVIRLYDDGTFGDVTSGDGVFSRDLVIPAYTVLQTQYKYSANFGDAVNNEGGNDNEAGFAQNHNLNLTKFMVSVTVVDTFGQMGNSDLKYRSEVGQTVVNLAQSWNMVSVARNVADFAKAAIFPTAVSNAFAYDAGYAVADPLEVGPGYWLKFGSAQAETLQGNSVTEATFNVLEGWNMIGSISYPVPVANIISDPPGLVTSLFYGYSSGYVSAATIEPGKGYWVKVLENGTLTLKEGAGLSAKSIRIVASNDVPPPPPEVSNDKVLPVVFELNQNYPNPFNPSTSIKYALPTTEFVSLKVFNLLGQEVATLVNGMQDAGYKSIELNASNLPSGVYLYKLTAGSFSDVKKMVIMK